LASIEPVEDGGGFACVVDGAIAGGDGAKVCGDRAKVGVGFASVVGGATVNDVEICG
jgi:hypothetical protein